MRLSLCSLKHFASGLRAYSNGAEGRPIALSATLLLRQPQSQSSTLTRLGLGLALAGVGLAQVGERRPAENCGIVGVIGTDNARTFLLEGLTVLQNRGYDSAGMATYSKEHGLIITKYASTDSTHDSIDLVKKNSDKHAGDFVGIAHTRWATHGGKTDENAHPHTDMRRQVALVHNGTINNSHELRHELQKRGVIFTSETDTEVIAQLIGEKLHKGMNLKEATSSALSV